MRPEGVAVCWLGGGGGGGGCRGAVATAIVVASLPQLALVAAATPGVGCVFAEGARGRRVVFAGTSLSSPKCRPSPTSSAWISRCLSPKLTPSIGSNND